MQNKLLKFFTKLERKVKSSVTDKRMYKEIGEQSKEIVQKRTRSGFGVTKSEGPLKRLPTLKSSTINIRKNLKKRGQLTGPGATPKKTAFNRTGKSLNNIQVKTSKSGVTLELDSHGKKAVKTTEKISKDYNFMDLSKSEAKKIKKEIESNLRSKLKGFLK